MDPRGQRRRVNSCIFKSIVLNNRLNILWPDCLIGQRCIQSINSHVKEMVREFVAAFSWAWIPTRETQTLGLRSTMPAGTSVI